MGGKPPGAKPGRVIVDGVESLLAGRAYAEPGSHRIVVVCGAVQRTQEVTLAAGILRELQIVPPPPPVQPEPARPPSSRAMTPSTLRHASPAATPAPPPPRRPPLYKRWWFWSIIGAAAVGATVGVVAATTGGRDRMPYGEMGRISID